MYFALQMLWLYLTIVSGSGQICLEYKTWKHAEARMMETEIDVTLNIVKPMEM